MQLTTLGRLIGWLDAGLLAVGLVLLNPLVFILMALVSVILVSEAIWFGRTVNLARRSVSVSTEPLVVEAMVDRRAPLKTTIRNSSRLALRFSALGRLQPSGVQTFATPSQISVSPLEIQEVSVLVSSDSPGRFETAGTTLSMVAKGGLFTQTLKFTDAVTLVAYPVARTTNTIPNVNALSELAVDPLRRGAGTDIAGLRPASFLEDFHRIDWKATARTGALVARDFYAEKEPTIMLLINIPMLKRAAAHGHSKTMLTQLAELLGDPFIAMSPIGLVMYDERTVVEVVDSSVGPESRERLKRTLLVRQSESSQAPETGEPVSRPYIQLVKDKHSLGAQQNHRNEQSHGAFRDLLESFAEKILPYYDTAISNHLRRMRSHGSFQAFETVANLNEPVLVLCLTDSKDNLSVLSDASKLATTRDHHVIIALIENGRKEHSASVNERAHFGMRVVRTTPHNLWRTINKELRLPRESRAIRAGMAQ